MTVKRLIALFGIRFLNWYFRGKNAPIHEAGRWSPAEIVRVTAEGVTVKRSWGRLIGITREETHPLERLKWDRQLRQWEIEP